ncbi:MAG: hypothetical protein KAS71_17340 [Bacteroidales bacterium]|nr:hypothetical protein [Bacteroidales bacterium]
MQEAKLYVVNSFVLMILVSIPQLYAIDDSYQSDSTDYSEKKVYFTIRYGQGGFSDERSPIGKLGGGQVAIDIKPAKLPLSLSISNEAYTNSSDPTESYEISDLVLVNCLYSNYFFRNSNLNVFAGPGIGILRVPQGEDTKIKATLFDMEAGVNMILFWKIGLYGTYKYLYANDGNLINFSEHIVLVGITFNFGL